MITTEQTRNFNIEEAVLPGTQFYYSLLGQQQAERRILQAIYAFHEQLHSISHRIQDIGVARTKLNWWQEELQRLAKGKARHPITQTIHQFQDGSLSTGPYLPEILECTEQLLNSSGFSDHQSLVQHCKRGHGSLGRMCAEVCGYTHHQTPVMIEQIWIAIQLTQLFQSLGYSQNSGYRFLNRDDLDRFNLSFQDFSLETENDLTPFWRAQFTRIQQLIDQAQIDMSEADRYQQRNSLILAQIQLALIKELRRDGYRIKDQQLQLTPIRMLWIAWRTIRKQRKYSANASS